MGAPKTGVEFPKKDLPGEGVGKDEFVPPEAVNENMEDAVEAPVLEADPNTIGELLAEGMDVEDAPKENPVDGEPKADDFGGCQAEPNLVSDVATAELRPKLGAEVALNAEPNTLVVELVAELPDFISVGATAELRPKLGAEPKRELPVEEDVIAVVPKAGEVEEEPNWKGTAFVTAVDA